MVFMVALSKRVLARSFERSGLSQVQGLRQLLILPSRDSFTSHGWDKTRIYIDNIDCLNAFVATARFHARDLESIDSCDRQEDEHALYIGSHIRKCARSPRITGRHEMPDMRAVRDALATAPAIGSGIAQTGGFASHPTMDQLTEQLSQLWLRPAGRMPLT